MNIKLIAQVRKLYEQHSEQQVLQAINYITEEQVWEAMDSQQREQFFRDQCKNLGLTVVEGTGNPARCLFVEQFKVAENSDHTTRPYFMFWRESTSHNSRGHIEFGHYHMNRKLDKQYPGTEYCHGGPNQQRALMKQYAEELKT
jgi:quinol monooxygenase YgiN